LFSAISHQKAVLPDAPVKFAVIPVPWLREFRRNQLIFGAKAKPDSVARAKSVQRETRDGDKKIPSY
jgi:hypothetical protein